MRFLAGCVALFSLAALCRAQTIDVRPAATPAAALPEFRPALIGRGPGALINQIDEQKLLKAGLKNAAVMFACTVRKSGEIAGISKFRSTPDSAALEQELRSKLAAVHFVPAVYHHTPVDVVFFGTASFRTINGKPRLRIFCNQETEDLHAETDFVAPQIVLGADSSFTGWHYPPANTAPVEVEGAVAVSLDVNDKGILSQIAILAEDPPLLGFAAQVSADLQGARFIPGFRSGLPLASKASITVYFSSSDSLFKVQPVAAPAP
jgi:hypothetical protein